MLGKLRQYKAAIAFSVIVHVLLLLIMQSRFSRESTLPKQPKLQDAAIKSYIYVRPKSIPKPVADIQKSVERNVKTEQPHSTQLAEISQSQSTEKAIVEPVNKANSTVQIQRNSLPNSSENTLTQQTQQQRRAAISSSVSRYFERQREDFGKQETEDRSNKQYASLSTMTGSPEVLDKFEEDQTVLKEWKTVTGKLVVKTQANNCFEVQDETDAFNPTGKMWLFTTCPDQKNVNLEIKPLHLREPLMKTKR